MPASEERSISQFPSALNILATTLLLVSTYDSGNDAYDSEKVSAVDLASAILGDFEYTQDLATNVKTIFGAINSIMVLSGTTVPTSQIGSNGQFYVKYTSSGGTDTVDGLYWKINNAWIEVSTGGGGGASVTLGTTVPLDASGSNGDLYVQYDGTTYAVIEYYVKINNSWRRTPFSRVVSLTQAEYDLITPDPSTLYIITDAQGSYVKLPVITDAYDATSTYAVGDLCIYNDTLYKCSTAITTPEAWNASHWTQTSIADELSAKASYTAVYNQNLASITRRAETVTTGATGNIATGIDNDGYYYILCPFVSGNNYKVECWVSSSNNTFYLTVRDQNGNTVNNTQVDIRYLIMRINRTA